MKEELTIQGIREFTSKYGILQMRIELDSIHFELLKEDCKKEQKGFTKVESKFFKREPTERPFIGWRLENGCILFIYEEIKEEV